MGILAEMREKQRVLKQRKIAERDEIKGSFPGVDTETPSGPLRGKEGKEREDEIKTYRDFEESQPALSERISEELFSAVHQAVGKASMCWEKPDNGGVFDYIQAGNIAFELCHKIADEIEAARDGKAGYIESTVPTPTVLFKGYETRR
jgi:hypothetical protein